MKPEDDLEMLRLCYGYAAESPDPRTQNGAIVVSDLGVILGAGFNRPPRKVASREDKNSITLHAEHVAILNAIATNLHGQWSSTLYGCWVCCKACALVIIESGIHEVVGHRHPAQDEHEGWSKSIAEAFELLREAGVKVRFVEGHIGATIRFNGKEVSV